MLAPCALPLRRLAHGARCHACPLRRVFFYGHGHGSIRPVALPIYNYVGQGRAGRPRASGVRRRRPAARGRPAARYTLRKADARKCAWNRCPRHGFEPCSGLQLTPAVATATGQAAALQGPKRAVGTGDTAGIAIRSTYPLRELLCCWS